MSGQATIRHQHCGVVQSQFTNNDAIQTAPLNRVLNLAGDSQFDVYVKNGGKEAILTSLERSHMTLGDALRLVGVTGGQEDTVIFDVTVEHKGANLLVPKVIVSASLDAYIKQMCNGVTTAVGDVEVPWLLAGLTRDNVIYLLKGDILPATCSAVTFSVKPQDLSATNGGLYEKFPHLKTMAIAHRHPGNIKPAPSGTDATDFKIMNDLLHIMNLLPRVTTKAIAGTVSADPGNVVVYNPCYGLTCSIDVGTEKDKVDPPQLHWQETSQIAYLAAVIYNFNGDKAYAEVMETELNPFNPNAQTKKHENCDYAVLSDQEIATALGMRLTEIEFAIDQAVINQDVIKKIKKNTYYPQPYYGDNYYDYYDRSYDRSRQPQRQPGRGWDYFSRKQPQKPVPVLLDPNSSMTDLTKALDEAKSVIAGAIRPATEWQFLTEATLQGAAALLREVANELYAKARTSDRYYDRDAS